MLSIIYFIIIIKDGILIVSDFQSIDSSDARNTLIDNLWIFARIFFLSHK